MKKILCAALLFAMLFAMTACDDGRDEQNSGTIQDVVTSTTASYNAKETESDTDTPQSEIKMKIKVGDTAFTAALADNSSVDAFKELLSDGPVTLDMTDYADMEKSADLGVTLPQNNEQMNTQAGDIILYQGRTLAIYYDTNSWSLTPIGKIEHADKESLKAALGDGDVTVTLSLEGKD